MQNCLPTRTVLHKWGLNTSPHCIREGCRNKETIDHVFWDCTFAKELLEVFRPLFSTNMILCKETVLFGLCRRMNCQDFCRPWAIINCIKSTLWVVTNRLFLKSEKIHLGRAKSMAMNEGLCHKRFVKIWKRQNKRYVDVGLYGQFVRLCGWF